MANSFKTSGKPAFGTFKESKDASEYINKKKESLLCNKNKNKNKKLCEPILDINYANLNINLITKLDLLGVPVLQSNNTPFLCPTPVNITDIPYLNYIIDPSGVLFGETTCGLNNYTIFMVLDSSSNS